MICVICVECFEEVYTDESYLSRGHTYPTEFCLDITTVLILMAIIYCH